MVEKFICLNVYFYFLNTSEPYLTAKLEYNYYFLLPPVAKF